MRFPTLLVAGLICIVLGVAGSEWSRRHPPAKQPAVVVPALTAEELSATASLADVPADEEAVRVFNAELKGFAVDARLPDGLELPDATAVLGGSLFARSTVPAGNAVFVLAEESKQGAKQAVLRITAAELPRALAVHRPGVTAIAVEGTRLYWSEGGEVYSTDAITGGLAKGILAFPKARVTALSVSRLGTGEDKVLVAALVPKELDVFSSEPVGAIVSVGLKDGKVKVLASNQIRPAETRTDGVTAVWIAGYPSALWQAELSGAPPRELSARGDGPVLLEGGWITFRHPVVGSPELLQLGPDGASRVLATGEIDRVTQLAGEVWFSVGAVVSRVDTRGENEKVVARLPQPVLELAATDDALYVVTRQAEGGHLLLRLPLSAAAGDGP